LGVCIMPRPMLQRQNRTTDISEIAQRRASLAERFTTSNPNRFVASSWLSLLRRLNPRYGAAWLSLRNMDSTYAIWIQRSWSRSRSEPAATSTDPSDRPRFRPTKTRTSGVSRRFRCEAAIRLPSGTKRTRTVSPIGAFVTSPHR
jgi:hypothetical protein